MQSISTCFTTISVRLTNNLNLIRYRPIPHTTLPIMIPQCTGATKQNCCTKKMLCQYPSIKQSQNRTPPADKKMFCRYPSIKQSRNRTPPASRPRTKACATTTLLPNSFCRALSFLRIQHVRKDIQKSGTLLILKAQ